MADETVGCLKDYQPAGGRAQRRLARVLELVDRALELRPILVVVGRRRPVRMPGEPTRPTGSSVASRRRRPADRDRPTRRSLVRPLAEVRLVLGDVHDADPDLHALCAANDRVPITIKPKPYPRTDEGVVVRRVVHEPRSRALQNFNSQFKATFDCLGQVPTRGWSLPSASPPAPSSSTS
jgi:hypothetical protein